MLTLLALDKNLRKFFGISVKLIEQGRHTTCFLMIPSLLPVTSAMFIQVYAFNELYQGKVLVCQGVLPSGKTSLAFINCLEIRNLISHSCMPWANIYAQPYILIKMSAYAEQSALLELMSWQWLCTKCMDLINLSFSLSMASRSKL